MPAEEVSFRGLHHAATIEFVDDGRSGTHAEFWPHLAVAAIAGQLVYLAARDDDRSGCRPACCKPATLPANHIDPLQSDLPNRVIVPMKRAAKYCIWCRESIAKKRSRFFVTNLLSLMESITLRFDRIDRTAA